MSGSAVCPTCGAPVAVGARFCASCGTPLAEAAPEERKLATILFADVIGSTDLGEQLDPERLRALLQDYFSAMAAVIDTWGGTIEKYIGDAILAVWGVPAARENDPVRALHAAREMLAELERINPELERRHGVQLGVRVGVNTGEVLAPVGAQPAGQFLVSGDAVNVAARLQQSAEPGTVLVGERTSSGARGAFTFGDPIELTVRGKRAAVIARRLGEPIEGGARDGGARPLQGPMLGRDRELSTLLGLLDEVIEEGSPRLVLVSGPAGMGKSRMLREFITVAAERRPELVVLRGRCLATGHGITFWALGEVLRQLCGISLDEPADSAADKLERRVAGPLAQIGLSADEIGRSAAALATSANLPLTHNPLSGLGPEEIGEEMAQAWPRLLSGLARSQPLALVIEDIHWADEPMLRMVEAIATRARGPGLIIATARPEFREAHAGFGTAADLSVVSLRALTEAQSAQLVGELLGSAQLPPALVEDIQRKADGNPFFLEEIIQRLIDEGALTSRDGQWLATEHAAAVQLPDTIYALLAARIDALPADEKRLLQEAAVVGRVFWPGALGAGVASEDVLRRAERRGLISLRPTSTIANEPEFIFRHVLIRDVAYNSVPRKRRALAHAETGRWLEELASDRLEELGELLAYHYSAAVTGDDADLGWVGDAAGREAVRRRAFEMLVRAGDSARRRFAVDKALALDEQALGLAATDEERALVHEALGDDHQALYHGDDAVREYLAAWALGNPPMDVVDASAIERRGRLAGKAGQMLMRWGTFQNAPPVEQVQAAIDAALATAVNDEVRATLLMLSGGLMPSPSGVPMGAGRVPMGPDMLDAIHVRIRAINDGLEIAERLDDVDLMYMGNDLLRTAYQAAGDYPLMRQAAEQQNVYLDRLPSLRDQVDSLVVLSSARIDGGNFTSALKAAEEALARSTNLSAHERMHAGYQVIAAAEPLGRWDRVEELLPWFAETAAAEGSVSCPSVRAGPAHGATVIARRGDIGRALAQVPVEESSGTNGTFLAMAHYANYASLVAPRSRAAALARHALDNTEAGFLDWGAVPLMEALVRLEMADELAQFLPIAQGEARVYVLIGPAIDRAAGLIALGRGERDEATSRLRAALASFEQLGAPFEVAWTQELLGGVVGEPERSELLASAAATFDSLGAVPFAVRSREALRTGAERTAR
jgi:class 3 adenylate cyclase/tetratricopeptide (TPR) repeat protein